MDILTIDTYKNIIRHICQVISNNNYSIIIFTIGHTNTTYFYALCRIIGNMYTLRIRWRDYTEDFKAYEYTNSKSQCMWSSQGRGAHVGACRRPIVVKTSYKGAPVRACLHYVHLHMHDTSWPMSMCTHGLAHKHQRPMHKGRGLSTFRQRQGNPG